LNPCPVHTLVQVLTTCASLQFVVSLNIRFSLDGNSTYPEALNWTRIYQKLDSNLEMNCCTIAPCLLTNLSGILNLEWVRERRYHSQNSGISEYLVSSKYQFLKTNERIFFINNMLPNSFLCLNAMMHVVVPTMNHGNPTLQKICFRCLFKYDQYSVFLKDICLLSLFQVDRIYQTDLNTDIIFNCQMGRGRTTTGMVITTLVYLNRIGDSGNMLSFFYFSCNLLNIPAVSILFNII
jgi:hypothetical protein